MTEFNLDLGKRVLEQITLHPEKHHQSDAHSCVLGWTVRLGDENQYWCSGDDTTTGAAKLLGISHFRATWIYSLMFNRVARWHLARLVHREERRRYRRDLYAAVRAARIEEETQRSLDLQARAQVRKANKTEPKKERVTV